MANRRTEVSRRTVIRSLGGVAIAVPFGRRAAAQTSSDSPAGPHIVASANAPVPAGRPIAVEMREDTEINVRLREDLIRELRAAGRPTDSRGPLVLYFSTQAYGRQTSPGQPSLGEFSADSEGRRRFRMNLFSTREDSLITGRQRTGTPPPAYRLSFELRDGATIIWRGYAEHAQDLGDAYRSLQPLARAVAERFGEDGRSVIHLY